jgi:hypothetical protein
MAERVSSIANESRCRHFPLDLQRNWWSRGIPPSVVKRKNVFIYMCLQSLRYCVKVRCTSWRPGQIGRFGESQPVKESTDFRTEAPCLEAFTPASAGRTHDGAWSECGLRAPAMGRPSMHHRLESRVTARRRALRSIPRSSPSTRTLFHFLFPCSSPKIPCFVCIGNLAACLWAGSRIKRPKPNCRVRTGVIPSIFPVIRECDG